MPLDKNICRDSFVDAMRVRLNELTPPAGNNVDGPEVKKNLAALGAAVFDITTVHADTSSSAANDAAFWKWVADINAYLRKVETWQKGVASAFNAWVPADSAGQALKAQVTGLAAPGDAPSAPPASMKGKIV